MLDISSTELLLVAMVALMVIGPKELPKALRTLGRMTGKAKAMTRHLRSGFDEMMRQAELEEMEKQWKAHNRKIMESAPTASDFDFGAPQPGPAADPDPADSGPAEPEPVDPLAPDREAPAPASAPPSEPRP